MGGTLTVVGLNDSSAIAWLETNNLNGARGSSHADTQARVHGATRTSHKRRGKPHLLGDRVRSERLYVTCSE